MAQTQRISRNNTAILKDSVTGLRTVVLHSTAILTQNADGTVTLRHGGYVTATTATRINQACNQWDLGIGVSRKNGVMYGHPRGTGHPLPVAKPVPFGADGTLTLEVKA